MPLISLKVILADADSGEYAAGLFNAVGSLRIKAFIRGAEERIKKL
jgi:fructose/tagatose bisphosphate aldolase